jgi:pimeloyl-ACP methyl ester carboxylesterase
VTAFSPSLFLGIVLAQATSTEPRAQAPSDLKPPSEVKASFLALLDRPKVPLDPKEGRFETEEKGGLLVRQLVSFATEKKADGTIERVPALVVKFGTKVDVRLPAVIFLHGTGGSKDSMRQWMDELAERGFLAISIDARYHGDRAEGAKGSEAYVGAITRAWRAKRGTDQEHPFYYDTCWDLWRTIDYLQTRDDVDPNRIGMLGVSMGGIETWLAAAVDDRVTVAVPAIAVQSFRWGLDNDAWQGRANTIKAAHEAAAKDLGRERVDAAVCRELWDKVIPGILDRYDGPSMIRLFAGRPLLILNGELDLNCPIGGARIAIASAETAYKEANATQKLKVMIAPGVGHSITPDQHKAAIAWFERWLKP